MFNFKNRFLKIFGLNFQTKYYKYTKLKIQSLLAKVKNSKYYNNINHQLYFLDQNFMLFQIKIKKIISELI